MEGFRVFSLTVALMLVAVCSFTLQSRRVMKTTPRNILSMSSKSIGCMLTTSDLSSSCPKEFNYSSLGMPRIIPPKKDGEDWLMWLHARNSDFPDDVINLSTGRILHARSRDGLSSWDFHPDSPVLNPNREAGGDWYFFDSEHVGLGDVIQPGDSVQSKFAVQDNIFLMYTFGGKSDTVTLSDGSKKVKGIKMEIGVAVSQDGAHWSRIEGPSPYGAILDAGASPQEFDGQFVGWPSVLEVGPEYRMYYHTYNPVNKKYIIGLASARDGLMRWSKRGPVFAGGPDDKFDGRGASRRHVVRLDGGSYRMWYEGVSSTGVHSIGLATSKDGTKWERVSDEPVFAPSTDPDAWDSAGVGSPHLVWLSQKRRWRMYYVGRKLTVDAEEGYLRSAEGAGGHASIGVAESTDEEGLFFERIQLK